MTEEPNDTYRIPVTNDNGDEASIDVPVLVVGDGPEYDEHGGLLQKTNPQRHTPASRRAYHKIIASYVILVLCLIVAFWALTDRAESRARCAAWDSAHLLALRTTDPISISDPRLVPRGVLESRRLFNHESAVRRAKTLRDLGSRPQC